MQRYYTFNELAETMLRGYVFRSEQLKRWEQEREDLKLSLMYSSPVAVGVGGGKHRERRSVSESAVMKFEEGRIKELTRMVEGEKRVLALMDNVLNKADPQERELIKHRYIDGETEYATYQKLGITRDEYLSLKQTVKKSIIEPLAESFAAYLGY
ncbi:hypothetical protein [Candidatus Contubernalis alkaliaceticus]|uniref:hypothetical protein n=1 Tax=Candidatus Contubernalis alkaliaceticus TaxID=338645 RepID=UPI001F4C43DD|nr:hypothetical protein [Candidatus Contubernalis alkalaceticus]UNC92407.1 hypothetical protein HUE98_10030 [Candidatus Contubernalis alkalaceticus]